MFHLARRRDGQRGRHGPRSNRAAIGACFVAGAVLCHAVAQALHHLVALPSLRALPEAFALTQELVPRGAALRAAALARSGRCRGDVSARAKGFGGSQAAKGFGAGGAAGASSVAEPAGGWPTVSVFLLNADGKIASHMALQHLAEQDYPADRIKEVVVGGASELVAEAPESLKKLLKDFAQEGVETLGIKDELPACSGDVVAFWGDDHVSSPSRLRTQVAAVVAGEAPSLLQPNWYFDPVSSDFVRVRAWPIAELEEAMGNEDATLPEGFAELMVSTDPLTLCAKREVLAAASRDLEPATSPSEEIKDLMLRLLGKHKPKVIDDMRWAVVRSPPSATKYEPATPDKTLVQIAEAVYPRGSSRLAKAAFGSVLSDIQNQELKPAEAVDRLLAEDVSKSLKQFDIERIYKAVLESLAKATPEETAAGISELLTWQGLAPGKGNAQMARNFPVFFAAFRAFRSHIKESYDLYDMRYLAVIAEGLVKLAASIWASDPRVNEVLAVLLTRELIGFDMREVDATKKATSTADIIGTLGLREVLQPMALHAMDMPGDNFPVSSLVNLAWSMGQGGIESGPLQMKVAKGILQQTDRLTPPDIGKLFIVIHEQRWFKDDSTIRYLLAGIMNQIQVLKQKDPGLAKILASAQA